MLALFTGILAGLIHVFSGPDHLAAIAPLSVEHRARPWVVGLRWGLGHASGVLLVGLLALGLRGVLPLDWLSSWSERVVGVALVGIGVWGIRKALASHVHAHEHEHGGWRHVHIHAHGRASAHDHAEPKAHAHSHAAFVVGTLHGLAGTSHLVGVLPALAFPTAVHVMGYLVGYGIGAVGAMVGFSSIVGLVARGFGLGGVKAYRALMVSCSSAAVLLGGYWLLA